MHILAHLIILTTYQIGTVISMLRMQKLRQEIRKSKGDNIQKESETRRERQVER